MGRAARAWWRLSRCVGYAPQRAAGAALVVGRELYRRVSLRVTRHLPWVWGRGGVRRG